MSDETAVEIRYAGPYASVKIGRGIRMRRGEWRAVPAALAAKILDVDQHPHFERREAPAVEE